MARLCKALLALALTACGAEGEDPAQPVASTDSGRADTSAPTDAKRDLGIDTTPADGTAVVSDTSGPITPPPPVEDTAFTDDYGVPTPGAHVEATIGPEGGELAGVSGPLAGVKLVVPKGALSATYLFAIDQATAFAPPGATLISQYVRIAPDGVGFSIPARLTLPWKSTVVSPQIGACARIGSSWSSLHDPVADATSITASMRRTSGAAAVQLDLAGGPTISTVTRSGTTIFIEGANFGLTQLVRFGDAGVITSLVKVSGAIAPTIGWGENSVAVTGGAGTITLTTPLGTATGP